jgi:hypothetical protein
VRRREGREGRGGREGREGRTGKERERGGYHSVMGFTRAKLRLVLCFRSIVKKISRSDT